MMNWRKLDPIVSTEDGTFVDWQVYAPAKRQGSIFFIPLLNEMIERLLQKLNAGSLVFLTVRLAVEHLNKRFAL